MTIEIIQFSDADLEKLRRIIAKVDSIPSNILRDGAFPYIPSAPDLYWVYVSNEPIPAASGTRPGSWTPGSLALPIYRLDRYTNQMVLLAPEKSPLIYNTQSIPSGTDTWVSIARDKFGEWYMLAGSCVVCDTVRFLILIQDAGTRSVLAQVTAVQNGCSLESLPDIIGTEIEICDPIGCFFNEPDPALIGRHGWAKYMLPLEINVCQPDVNYLIPMWEVFSLCPAPPECSL